MGKIRFALVFFLGLLSQYISAQVPAADIVLTNGRIWTGDDRAKFVSAVAIRGNKIIAIGSSKDAAKWTGRSTKLIDLQGRFAMPGINDSHIHFLGSSMVSMQVDLTDAKSVDDAQRIIKQYAETNPDAKWITGSGWQYTIFPNGLPTSKMIDAVVGDRPVFIRAYDGHTGWANSKAMQMAGITSETTFSGFGEIVKDANGVPTGAFKEGAMGLFSASLPKVSRDTELAALRAGLKNAASLGITSIQNASGGLREAELYDTLLKSGELTLRVKLAFSLGNKTQKPEIDAVSAASIKYATPFLSVGAVKLLVDGVIESHTAVMLKPYADDPGTGNPNFDQARLNEVVSMADKAGLQVYIHAIGDGGVRMALDSYAAAVKTNGKRDSRFRIEHIETIDPADIPRFKQLGVIASMEPIHADPGTVDVWSAAIGPDRTSRGFAWKTLESAGAKLIFSSDYPAAISMSPWRGLHNAVNRQTIDGKPAGGWQPQNRVSVQTALMAYTANGAFASFEEKTKGQIKPGMLADMIVLDRDPFVIPSAELYKIQVLTTIVDGRIVFEKK